MTQKSALHWTQRPENKRKVQTMLKRAARSRKARRTATSTPPTRAIGQHADTVPHDTFAYALGYTECWISAYAQSAGVSPAALAAQLGKVLSIKSRR